MKFALLGADEDMLALARWIAASDRHELSWACELGEWESSVRAMSPDTRIARHWETFLSSPECDAALIARGANDDDRAEQLRKLTQASVPMLIAHPIHDSMLIYYELDMIRRDTGGAMMPYVPLRWHVCMARLVELVQQSNAGAIGHVEQCLFDRALADRGKASVERQFARDVEVLRALCGELSSVSAMASAGGSQPDYANLCVQLAGQQGAMARWSVVSSEAKDESRLTLIGARGKATVALPEDLGAMELEIHVAGQQTTESFPAFDAPAAAIAQFERAVAGQSYYHIWQDACRDVELTEAIARSLKKRRTIELHDEEYSEHGTFKGTMTSVGCALLCAALVLFVIAVALGRITGKAIFAYAPHAIAGILIVFLGAQLLKLVFPRDEDRPNKT